MEDGWIEPRRRGRGRGWKKGGKETAFPPTSFSSFPLCIFTPSFSDVPFSTATFYTCVMGQRNFEKEDFSFDIS
jgi:hypothetical protein